MRKVLCVVLVLKESVAIIHSKRRRGDGMGLGRMNIHFAKWIVTTDLG
jgi:hypothetical protein